jgi:hypothetical protein
LRESEKKKKKKEKEEREREREKIVRIIRIKKIWHFFFYTIFLLLYNNDSPYF